MKFENQTLIILNNNYTNNSYISNLILSSQNSEPEKTDQMRFENRLQELAVNKNKVTNTNTTNNANTKNKSHNLTQEKRLEKHLVEKNLEATATPPTTEKHKELSQLLGRFEF